MAAHETAGREGQDPRSAEERLREPESESVARVAAEVDRLNLLLVETRAEMHRMQRELDAVRSRNDVDQGWFDRLAKHRTTDAYRKVYEGPPPRVSVCIATYNCVRLLVGRCLPSILSQDYPNLEVVVVGDACTDNTPEAVARIGDPRLRFENLARREAYPEDPVARWMVAGTAAGNRSLEMARGDLITHLDDDDEFEPGRIRKLVDHLRETRAEVVYHPFAWELAPGHWRTIPAEEYRHGQVTCGSVLYGAWFNHFQWDPMAYRYHEPGDWNRFRKFKYLGARLSRHPETLLRKYAGAVRTGEPMALPSPDPAPTQGARVP